MKQKMFALIDCNNFYASCERIFNPKLLNKPIVILSNNDGCIIARSNEAKALGIPMGGPYHESKNLILANGVKVFSANFEFYGDISSRVMSILKTYAKDFEIYSIDEAFLNLETMHIKDYKEYGLKIRKNVLQWTGVTTSIGIAPTKTLAKTANKLAKKLPESNGVIVLDSEEKIDQFLKNISVSEIWGIGWNLTKFLNSQGVYTAYDLKSVDDRWAKATISVVGQRIVFELRGISCIPMEKHVARKGIMSSRSFGKNVTSLLELKEAVSCFTVRASEKLRSQGSLASNIFVSLRTNKHITWERQCHSFAQASLETPTSYSPDLIRAALRALDEIFIPGLKYKKASVMLTGIVPETTKQLNLFAPSYEFERYKTVMKAFDVINNKFGNDTLIVASQGNTRPWKGKREMVTNRYTTKWEELLTI